MRFEAGSFDPDHYELFFSLSLDMFSIGGIDGLLKHVNAAWAKTLGLQPDEIKSRPIFELVHPEDLTKSIECAEQLKAGHEITNFQNRIRCSDGSYRDFLWSCKKHPHLDLIYSVTRDITEFKKGAELLKKAQAEAQAQNERMNSLFSQVPAAAAVVKGPGLIFEFVNEGYASLVGGRELIGKSVQEALPSLDPAVFEILNEVYTSGQRFVAQEHPVRADWHANGKVFDRFFNFIYEPIRDPNGLVSGIWAMAFEVTEFKEMQSRLRISEKMASLGTLAAGVAHEVNNPLSFVMGHIHFLQNELETIAPEDFLSRRDEIVEKMQITEKGLERIRKIVKALKLFSRDHEERIKPVNVEECLRSAVLFAENEIKYRAQIVFDLKKTVPPVLADEGQLGQVFLNLLVNAAQAIPAGAAEENQITIRCEPGSSQDVLISITDTGNGIPPEIINRIFEPFFTSKPVGEGTGLGLSICHGIIASFRGEITVESYLGIGTTFKVRLPAAQSLDNPVLDSELITSTERCVSFEGNTILIVDDEESLAEVIAMMLEPDYQALTAFSVLEALDLIQSNRPDLILCDLMMPRQTGMDLYQKLEAQDPELAKRIIFMTGGVFAPEAKSFLSRTRVPTLEKPFASDRLKAFVHSILLRNQNGSAVA